MKSTPGPGDKARHEAWMCMLSLVCLPVVFLTLSRATHPQTLEGTSAPQTTFVLTIYDDLIWLSAKDASLKAMLEEIGRQMHIQVDVQIPAAATVTLAFERLPLPEVLQRFGRYVNYGYVGQWDGGKLRVSAITVPSLKVATLPSGAGVDASQGLQERPPAARLEMDIDPSRYLREKRH